MEGIEKSKPLETEIIELLATIEKIKWRTGYEFSYNGLMFCIHTIDAKTVAKGKSGEPAEYYRSSETGGWDIYLHNTIPKTERKRVLFHEILEASLREHDIDEEEAHKITLEKEEQVFGKRN